MAEVLYLRWYDRVFRRVLLVTGDQDCAVEATHEAFLRAFERYDMLREPDKFPVWVVSIAINIARDMLRTRKREVPSTGEELEALGQVHIDSGPERFVSRNEDVAKLREAVGRLPADSRSVIVLYYVDECSVADIAVLLGIPEGTVKSRLHAARALLRRMMGENLDSKRGITREGT